MSDTESRRVVITVRDEILNAPATAEEAVALLDRGNATFASLGEGAGVHEVSLSPEAIGLPRTPGSVMAQEPFAAALGCADARVPLELVFGCSGNEIFTTRVAGNVPGSDVVGSMHYAMANLPTIRAVLVLGHSSCGAVTAAVDALLHPETYLQVVRDPELRGIVDSLLATVRLASLAITEVHGPGVASAEKYREALIEVATVANAAVTASVLDNDLDRDVVFGVYDLKRRSVGVLTESGWAPGLRATPRDDAELTTLLLGVAKTGALAG